MTANLVALALLGMGLSASGLLPFILWLAYETSMAFKEDYHD
jgi:hypothetical protein